jgi:peptide-methionine (S)-S-oxide reductase
MWKTYFRKGYNMERAIFAAGCFWGVEAAFRKAKGVTATAVGYSGGTIVKPSYHDVCSGQTGHAEVVMVEFEPDQVTYEELLKIFFDNHDSTQVNRQGPDVGTQYRTAIFYLDDFQKEAAVQAKKALDDSGNLKKPVATLIEPAGEFYLAEDYHQQYLEKRGLATCHI